MSLRYIHGFSQGDKSQGGKESGLRNLGTFLQGCPGGILSYVHSQRTVAIIGMNVFALPSQDYLGGADSSLNTDTKGEAEE